MKPIRDRDLREEPRRDSGREGTPGQPIGPADSTPNDTYDTYETVFRTHYETTYAGSAYEFARLEPAYRFGYELGSRDANQAHDWDEVVTTARRNWEQDHPDEPWDEVKDAVYKGWGSVTNLP